MGCGIAVAAMAGTRADPPGQSSSDYMGDTYNLIWDARQHGRTIKLQKLRACMQDDRSREGRLATLWALSRIRPDLLTADQLANMKARLGDNSANVRAEALKAIQAEVDPTRELDPKAQAAIEQLLQGVAADSVNRVDSSTKRTALEHAILCRGDTTDVVKELVAAGAHPLAGWDRSGQDTDRWLDNTALGLAVRYNHETTSYLPILFSCLSADDWREFAGSLGSCAPGSHHAKWQANVRVLELATGREGVTLSKAAGQLRRGSSSVEAAMAAETNTIWVSFDGGGEREVFPDEIDALQQVDAAMRSAVLGGAVANTVHEEVLHTLSRIQIGVWDPSKPRFSPDSGGMMLMLMLS